MLLGVWASGEYIMRARNLSDCSPPGAPNQARRPVMKRRQARWGPKLSSPLCCSLRIMDNIMCGIFDRFVSLAGAPADMQ